MSTLHEQYRQRYLTTLRPLANKLETLLLEYFLNEPRLDRISVRAKSINHFMNKAEKLEDEKPKYTEPLRQIQDQIGARIIAFYNSDVQRLDSIVEKYFRPVETTDLIPDTEWQFGYFGRHHILVIPQDIIDPDWNIDFIPDFFELQVKTLFQHAWSEANHDLGYKPGSSPLSSDELRRLAFASAQSWGADLIFEELFQSRLKQPTNSEEI
jgi:putative GTP pyrophosphokinase